MRAKPLPIIWKLQQKSYFNHISSNGISHSSCFLYLWTINGSLIKTSILWKCKWMSMSPENHFFLFITITKRNWSRFVYRFPALSDIHKVRYHLVFYNSQSNFEKQKSVWPFSFSLFMALKRLVSPYIIILCKLNF